MPCVLNLSDLPGYSHCKPVIPPNAVYIGRPGVAVRPAWKHLGKCAATAERELW